MTLVRKTMLAGVAALTFAMAATSILALGDWLDWMPPTLPEAVVPVFVLAVTVIPATAGWLAARVLARRWRLSAGTARARFPRALAWPMAVAYALTVVFGVPAVQSRRDAWAIAEYKQLKASGSRRVWDSHPYIRTYAAIPVFPAVIISYHEYQLDGLYGLGAFEVAVWYGTGVLPVAAMPIWIS